MLLSGVPAIKVFLFYLHKKPVSSRTTEVSAVTLLTNVGLMDGFNNGKES